MANGNEGAGEPLGLGATANACNKPDMRLVCATHGHCFDGLASAVVFTMLAESLNPTLEFSYFACGYGAGQRRADTSILTGEENAILDYRFTPAKELTWYFDHHATAFASEADRAVFEARRGSGRYYFDPEYSSCTKLIADVAKETYGLALDDLTELIDWADIVDAARFASAEQAIDRTRPVMQLATVVEHYGDDRFLRQIIPELLKKPLNDVARSTAVQERHAPLGKRHERFVERVRTKSQERGRVVLCDLTDSVADVIGKFVTYALYPDSEYSVIVGLLKNGIKVSVGFNPWSGKERDTDISAICARYGGGGHPFVGGISFERSQLDHARQVAEQIVNELSG